MTETTGSLVHIGTWINWSHGRILGSTITLSERNGGLLTAFLATFVATAGVASWTILTFALHQIRSRKEKSSAIHQQQQVTLRNSGTPSAAAWQFIQLIWYWRKHAARPFARTLPLLLVALLNIVIFAVASIFSSEVTRAAGNEVLIQSPNCGMLLLKDSGSAAQGRFSDFNKVETNDTSKAATYAQACYGDTPDPLQCNQYAQRSISWKSYQNSSCPFSSDICVLGSNAGYEMDTGPLDSHKALGINAPKQDRVHYRKVTTCSPISAKKHFEAHNDTDPDHIAYGDTLVDYLFGGGEDGKNYTFQYNTHSLVDQNGYELTAFVAYAGASHVAWDPIPALSRTDGDVSILFLTPNSITYQEPVTDPFYSATTPTTVLVGDVNVTFYSPDYFVYVMACVDQHQFCNPSTNECTPLTGAYTLGTTNNVFQNLNFNTAQYATAIHISLHLTYLTTYSNVHTRGPNALRASDTLNGIFQIGLPNTQWMTEASSWFGTSLAKLQQKVIDYATGPSTIPESYNLVKPQTKEEKQICNNQIIRRTSGTTSFSVLGVAIILSVGTVLIVTSLVLDTLVQYVRRKRGSSKQHKSLQWVVDEKLQLQRLAYEEAGQGHWRAGTSAVPLTAQGDKIGLPRDADMTHPRLSQAVGKVVVSSEPSTPEAVGLMEQKGPRQEIQYMPR